MPRAGELESLNCLNKKIKSLEGSVTLPVPASKTDKPSKKDNFEFLMQTLSAFCKEM